VLEKVGEDYLHLSCETLINTKGHGKEEYSASNKRRNVNWISHILCSNRLLKHVIEGKKEGRLEVTERRGGRRQLLLNGLKEKRGYCKLKEEAIDRTVWRTRFGRCDGIVVRLRNK